MIFEAPRVPGSFFLQEELATKALRHKSENSNLCDIVALWQKQRTRIEIQVRLIQYSIKKTIQLR